MVKLIKDSNIRAMKATGLGKSIKPRRISEKVELPDNWSEESKTLVKKAEAIAKEFFGKAWDGFTDKQQHDVIMGMLEELGKLLDKENKKLQKESLKVMSESLRDDIYSFLDELGGYAGYDKKVEYVMDEFGLDRDEAEGYVWTYTSGVEGTGLW